MVALEEEEELGITIEAREVENKIKLNMKERKVSWARMCRVDSLNPEAGRVPMSHTHSSMVVHGAMLFVS